MKIFDLKGTVLSLTTPNIVSLLNSIELYRGKTMVVTKLKKLDSLKEVARRTNAICSNYMGNVFLSDSEERDLFDKGAPAETFNQHIVKGYCEALDLIDKVYKFQPFDRSFISTLHLYMYKNYNREIGGKYKDSQNYIQEMMPDGTYRTIFVPPAPEEVIPLLDNLINQFNLLAADEEVNKLLLISAFLLDFMCIHPYNHGNGRLSRLILNFLLKKYGYNIDNYYSTSLVFKQRMGDYIDVFEGSAKGWEDNTNDYSIYVSYVLRTLLESYHRLDYIIEINNMNGTAEDKISRIILDSDTPLTKQDVQNILYATSPATIEKALAGLLRSGKIQLINKGRYSKYFRM